jgi:hypothetical protein
MQNAFNFCETDNTPINLSTLLQDPSGNFITSAQWTIFDSGSSSWIIPSVINSINVDSIIQQFGPINSPSENFDLNYSYADPLSGCLYSGAVSITINSLVQVNTAADVCALNQISVLAAANYQWTNIPASAAQPVNGSPYSWTPQPSDVANSPYELITSNGCSQTSTSYTVHYIDVELLTANDTICEGASVTLTANALPAGAYNYSWCEGGCASFTTGTNTFTNLTVNTSTTYIVQVSDPYCSITASQIITVESEPTFYTTSVLGSFCETDVTLIDFTQMLDFNGSYPASNVQWMACNQILNNSGIPMSDISSICGPINSDTSIYVSYYLTSDFGCQYQDSTSIEILNQGVNSTTAAYCADLPVTISPGQNGVWDYVALPASFGASVSGNDLTWYAPNGGGPYLVTFNGECSEYNYNITMHDFDVDLTADDDLICPNQEVILTAQISNASSASFNYEFSYNGSVLSSGIDSIASDYPSNNTTYLVEVMDLYGCIRTDDVDVAIDFAPTQNIGLLSNTYCETSLNDSIELDQLLTSSSGNNITNAVWTICGSIISQNILTIQEIVDVSLCGPVDDIPSDTTTFQLLYLYDNGNCAYTDSLEINILDESEQTEILTYCAGEIINLAGTGTWLADDNLPAGAPGNCDNCNFNWVTTIADSIDNVVIEYNNLNACGATFYDVTIHPTPTLTANSFSEICVNVDSTLNFTTNLPLSSYQWIVDGDSIDAGILDPDGMALLPGTVVPICIWGENTFGCDNQDCFDVIINGLPAPITLDIEGIHCEDAIFQVPVYNNVTYEVEFTSSQDTLNYFEGDNFLFPENTNWSYNIVLTSASGCVDEQQGTLQVLDTPVADITLEPYNNCSPIITVQNNSTGNNATYSWTSDLIAEPLSTFQFSPNPLNVPITVIDAYHPITFSIQNACGEASDDVSVYFQAPPVAFLSSDFLPNFNCSPQCGTIDAECPSTTTIDQIVYSWPGLVDTNTGQTSITTSSLAELPYVCFEVEDAVVTNLFVEITNACGSAVDSIPLVMIPPQVAAAFTIEEEACPGDEILIIDESFPGVGASVTYEIEPPGQGVYLNGESIVILPDAIPDVYEITQTVEGCGVSSLMQQLIVHEAPTVELEEFTEVYCTGESIAFNANASEFMELYWSFGDGFETVGYTDIEYIYETTGQYTVSVYGVTLQGCSDSDAADVLISGQDQMLIASDSIFCGNTLFNAFPDADSWGSLVWNIYPNPGIENMPSYGPEFNHIFINETDSLMHYTLTMNLTNGDGCGSYNELDIVVKPSTSVNLRWEDRNDCEFPIDNSIIITDYNPNWNYIYEIPDAESTYRSGSKIHGVFYTSQTILVTSLNEFGCTSSNSIDLVCNEWPVYVPNAVTADDDGVNEYFKPIFSNEPFEYELTIYNRWGDIVFHSTNPNEYWIMGDRSSNQYYVIDDVYNWLLTYKSFSSTETQEVRGHVNVIR